MFPSSDSSFPRCWAQIDSQALIANLNALPVPPRKAMAIVKADAYGHGVDLIAPELANNGVRNWGVATVAEGIHLRQLLGQRDEHEIYVMPAVLPREAPHLVSSRLTPYCCDIDLARALSNEASKQGTKAALHIEVDTGIGRAGVQPNSLPDFIGAVRHLPAINITGICTHFTAADSTAGPEDALGQFALFERALAALDPDFVSNVVVHAANSPAALRIPGAHKQLIRPGLLLYGIGPCRPLIDGSEAIFPYRPVMSLFARVLLVRRLPAGTDISYSRTFRLDHDATIATIGMGYGDGFPRRLSNRGGALLPDGTRVPMRGRVCMDQICLEIPDGASLKPGDPVTLIGSAGSSSITALEIADAIDATPHEIPTCLTARVPRLLV